MKRIGCLICVLVLCAFLSCSCAQSSDSGVVIVPSSHTETAAAEITAAETTAAAETAVMETEAAVTETTAVCGDASADGDILSQAQAMMEDAAFSALLEQYGGDGASALGAVAAVLAYQQSQEYAENTVSEDTVWWTDGGSVWHVTRECSALAKSKSVRSGTAADAEAVGKTRACKRCGG